MSADPDDPIERSLQRIADSLEQLADADLVRSAIKLADRFAAKGRVITANEILREVGLPEQRWA